MAENTVSQVQWYKGNKKLEHGGRYSIRGNMQDGKFSLVIRDSKLDDTDDYRCIAKNDSGQAECNAEVLVQKKSQKPQFEGDFGPFSVKAGDNLKLSINVVSHSKVKVLWYRDELLVTESEFYKISADDSMHTLELNNSKLDQTGMYKIVATNDAGSSEMSMSVTVVGK